MKYRRSFFTIISLVLILIQLFPFSPASANSDEKDAPQLTWTSFYGPLKDEDFHSTNYAYGNGIYVAAEGYTSKDGIHWTNIPALDQVRLQLVVWGKGRFVGIPYESNDEIAIWTSTDGLNWTENAQKIETWRSWSDIVFNGTRFVALGHPETGYYYTSEDGLKWTERSSNLKFGLGSIAWGNGTLVALGGTERGNAVAVSKDGLAWKQVSVPIKDYYGMMDIVFAGENFVAVGDYFLMTSKDGLKWSSVPSEGIFYSRAIWVKDRFFVEGFKYVDARKKQGTIAVLKTSKDGKKWADLTGFGPLSATHYGSMSHLNLLFDGKQYINRLDHGVYSSRDGVKWTQVKSTPIKPYRLTRSTIGNGKLVAVGGTVDSFDPEVEKLADRGSWVIDSSGKYQYNLEFEKFPLYDVVWKGNYFFAVGSQGLMMTSKDGLKWAKAASPTSESLYRIVEAKGTFYTVGSGGVILSSKDLKNWKKHKTPVTSALNSITWDGQTFVAVGVKGVVLVSSDGSTWTKLKSFSTYDYTDITWGNGMFVIASSDGRSSIFKSPDGRKWSEGPAYAIELYNVVFTGEMFVAVGRKGTVMLSYDAIHWQERNIPVNALWENAQVFNDKLYIFGYHSDIYYAEL